MLSFGGVGAGADIPAHGPDVSQEKTSQSQAAGTAVRSVAIGEVVYARSIRVAWNAQVLREADIGTEFEGMVSVRLGPVGHKLELLFAFNQRAIAAGNTQSIAKRIGIAAIIAIEIELTPP